MYLDHIAINSNNIYESVYWYVNNLNADLIYIDETWGLVSLEGTKIAFVLPSQHSAHTAFRLPCKIALEDKRNELIEKGLKCSSISLHRDRTESFYLEGINSQVFEWIVYPDEDN